MAVFSEVLNISIDTAMFAAQMAEVEAIYTKSLTNMPQLGDMGAIASGAAFKTAAEQIESSANAIEISVASMRSVVERSMMVVAESAVVGAETAAVGLKRIPTAAREAQTSIERFEGGFESAMYRIPGRFAVIALIGVAIGALLTPLKLLKDGFEALASSSTDFKAVHTELSNMLSIFEQVATRPVFNLVLEGMKQVRDWLESNRSAIDSFLDGVGKIGAAFLKAFSGDAFSVLKGFAPLLAILGLVFNDLAFSVNTSAIALGAFLALLDPRNVGKEFDIAKEKVAQLADAFKAHEQVETSLNAAITGQKAPEGTNLEEGITAKNEQPKYAELLAKYKLAQQGIRDADQQTFDKQKILAETYVITKKKADDEIVKSAEDAQSQIQKLGEEFISNIEHLSPADAAQMDSKAREEIDQIRKGLLGGGGPQSPITRDQNRVRQAKIEQFKDEQADQKINYEILEKNTAAHYAEEVKMAKDNAAKHRETYLAAYDQETAAENKRYEEQKINITKMPGGALGTEPERLRAEATQTNERTHKDFLAEADNKHLDVLLQDATLQEKIVDLQNKYATTVINAQLAQAKLIGDKKTELELGQALLEQKAKDADAALRAAVQRLFITPSTGPENAKAIADVTEKQAAANTANTTAQQGSLTLQFRILDAADQILESEAKTKIASDQTVESYAKAAKSKTEQVIANKALLADELKLAQASLDRATNDVKSAQAAGLAKDVISALIAKQTEAQRAVNVVGGQVLATAAGGAASPEVATVEEANAEAVALARVNKERATSLDNKRKEVEATLNEAIALEKVKALELEIAEAAIASAKTQGRLPEESIAAYQARIASLQHQLDEARSEHGAAQQTANIAEANATPLGQAANALGVNFGKLKEQIDDADNGFQAFVMGLGGATTALGNLAKGVVSFIDMLHKGNIGGAIGGGLSQASGLFSAAGSEATQLSNAPAGTESALGGALAGIGQVASVLSPVISGVMSVVTSLFEQSIQNMVTDINEQIQAINQQAQLKQIGIQEQIKELQQEEANAISMLGGKKKAQSQLQTILQSLNSEIAQLQFQAAQTIQQFNDMVSAANTGTAAGNQVATQWLSTWTSINQQVEAYVQAGGSLATAAQYLNQQLQLQQQTLTNQLNQGYQTAIGDALQLNQLEQQKVQMMKQEAATEFGMLNADSVERRTASAVATGVALTNQRNQYSLQMQTMNQQIALEQGRVAAESQVYNLNMSIAALQNTQNALNIAALNQQLLQYQEIQKILAATQGINFTAGGINPNWGLGGSQAPIPGLSNVAGGVGSANIGTVNITINGAVTTDNVSDLASEIATNIRNGRTTFSTVGG